MREQSVNKHIGSALKALRTAAGITQDHVAFFTRICRERYGRIERDRGFPTVAEVNSLIAFFNVDLEALGLCKEDLAAAKNKPGREVTRLPALREKKKAEKKAEKKEEKKEKEKVEKKEEKKTEKKVEEHEQAAPVRNPQKRTLPPISKRISDKGTRSLIHATLYAAIHDARSYDYDATTDTFLFEDAEDFARSTWCRELCEGIGLDYKTYREHVLSICRKTVKLAVAIMRAKDPIKAVGAVVFADSYEAQSLCKELRQDYSRFVDLIHRTADHTLAMEARRKKG